MIAQSLKRGNSLREFPLFISYTKPRLQQVFDKIKPDALTHIGLFCDGFCSLNQNEVLIGRTIL